MSSKSESSSSSSPWGLIIGGVVGAAVAVGLGVGLYYARRSYSKEQPEETKKEEKKKVKKVKEPAPEKEGETPAPVVEAKAPKVTEQKAARTETKAVSTKKRMKLENQPSAKELAEQLSERMNTLQHEQKVSSRDKELLEYIRNTDPLEFEEKERIQVVQGMILIHAMQVMQAQTEAENKLAELEAKKDWPVCWDLLDFPEEARLTDEEKRVVEQFKLDVAIRLEDKFKLTQTFDSIYNSRNLTDDEFTILFTVAPNIGKWKAFQALGQQLLLHDENALKQFHMISISRPEMVDYEQLFNMTKGMDDAEFKDICWKTYTIKSIQVKLQTLDCNDEEKKKQLRDETGPDFTEMPVQDSNKVVVMGAFARSVSTTNLMPVPITGPVTPNKLRLKGYIDIKGREMFIHQEDDYNLQKDADMHNRQSLWKGTYTTKQNNAAVQLTMVFECKMMLQEEDQ